MTNATTPKKIELYGYKNDGDPIRYTVAAGTGILKGTVLALASDRTASASVGTADVFGGIAAMEKDSSDPSTSISAWQNGVFEFTASGGITVGNRIKTAAADNGNYVMGARNADVTSSFAIAFGTALNTAADGAAVRVRIASI